jgi:hypothetical protein
MTTLKPRLKNFVQIDTLCRIFPQLNSELAVDEKLVSFFKLITVCVT